MQPIEITPEFDPRIPDLVKLIIRLSRVVKSHCPAHDLPDKAINYLQRKNLMPDTEATVLRKREGQTK